LRSGNSCTGENRETELFLHLKSHIYPCTCGNVKSSEYLGIPELVEIVKSSGYLGIPVLVEM
jgi:hypothetical protein